MGVTREVREALTWLEKASTRRDLANLERFGIAATRPSACRWPTCSAGQASRPRSRPGRRALGDRLVRGAHAGRVRRRAGAGHAGADGSLVPRLRQLGHLRHRLLLPVRSHAARVAARSSAWARRRDEFVKRAAFALLASLALHDKRGRGRAVPRCLPLIEAAASDERNFVKKGVSWALRAIGRRNVTLHAEALAVARRLSAAADAAPRWIGKGALRELTSPVVMRKLAGRPRRAR